MRPAKYPLPDSYSFIKAQRRRQKEGVNLAIPPLCGPLVSEREGFVKMVVVESNVQLRSTDPVRSLDID
jgi:hypothetical protein